MSDVRPAGSGRVRRAPAAMLLAVAVGALGLTAGCGGDDSKPKESRAELEAQLATLPKHIEVDFRAGDTNHDLRLQDTELDAIVKEDFAASDVVKDGEINEADIRKDEDKSGAGVKGEETELDVEASLAFIDLNKDGRVPFEEYKEHVDRHFHQVMDTNKDAHIDPSESVAFYQRLLGETK